MTAVDTGWQPKTEKKKAVRVKAQLQWASLRRINKNGDHAVDLTNLSDAAVERLEGLGINVRKKDDAPEKGYFITCKSQNPIKSYLPEGDENFVEPGNGSTAEVDVTYYDWTHPQTKKPGRSGSIVRLVITDLIPFESSIELENEEAF